MLFTNTDIFAFLLLLQKYFIIVFLCQMSVFLFFIDVLVVTNYFFNLTCGTRLTWENCFVLHTLKFRSFGALIDKNSKIYEISWVEKSGLTFTTVNEYRVGNKQAALQLSALAIFSTLLLLLSLTVLMDGLTFRLSSASEADLLLPRLVSIDCDYNGCDDFRRLPNSASLLLLVAKLLLLLLMCPCKV